MDLPYVHGFLHHKCHSGTCLANYAKLHRFLKRRSAQNGYYTLKSSSMGILHKPTKLSHNLRVASGATQLDICASECRYYTLKSSSIGILRKPTTLSRDSRVASATQLDICASECELPVDMNGTPAWCSWDSARIGRASLFTGIC